MLAIVLVEIGYSHIVTGIGAAEAALGGSSGDNGRASRGVA